MSESQAWEYIDTETLRDLIEADQPHDAIEQLLQKNIVWNEDTTEVLPHALSSLILASANSEEAKQRVLLIHHILDSVPSSSEAEINELREEVYRETMRLSFNNAIFHQEATQSLNSAELTPGVKQIIESILLEPPE